MKNNRKVKMTQHYKMQELKKKDRKNLNKSTHNASLVKGLWLCGKHPTFVALQKKRREVFEILATKNSVSELEKFLAKNNLQNLHAKIRLVEGAEISAIVGEDVLHQGLALNCSRLPLKSQNDLLTELQNCKQNAQNKFLPPLLILDQLNDPHNIGAIIRSACAFGVKKIIFPEHNFPKESAVMNKAASGMVDNADLFLVVNLNNLMEKLKELGYWCVGLAGEASQTIDEIKDKNNLALIVGREGEGMRDLVKKNCDFLVKIKMDESVESLNASVAAAVAMYELFS